MRFQRAHALVQFTLAANQLRQFFGKGFQALVSLVISLIGGARHCLHYRYKPMSESGIPLPPATFEFLVFSLKMQAEMRLGLLKLGEGMDEELNLPAARHTIDMLAMIAEKTKGNLSLDEQRLVENSLTELRFRFVQVSESVPKPTSGEKQPAAE